MGFVWFGPNELNNRCERVFDISVIAMAAFSSQKKKIPPANLSTHVLILWRVQKVRQSMLTHYHKAEGIQIIGPLKPLNVNWAKLQLARVAVAEADAYIITVLPSLAGKAGSDEFALIASI